MTTPTQGPGPLAIRHEAGTNLESNSSSISAMSTLVETGRGCFRPRRICRGPPPEESPIVVPDRSWRRSRLGGIFRVR